MPADRYYVVELEGAPVNTDATGPIQRAIDAANAAGGGIVRIPSGYFVTRGLSMRSRVTIAGEGIAATTLKLADNCNRNLIETANFSEDIKSSKKWLVQDGMCHGFGVRDIRLHGNKNENSSGHGIAVYGKHYILENVMIVACASDGLYSQGPDIGGQAHIDDTPEAMIRNLQVHLCRGNGIVYRGPHDAYIESAIVGECHGVGVVTETKVGVYNGAVDIGRLHVYSCQQGIIVGTASTSITKLVADTNYAQGVIVNAHRVQIGQLWAFRNWRPGSRGDFRSSDTRLDASVELNQACQIGSAVVRTDFGGTGIRVKGSRTQIGSCQIENDNPREDAVSGIGLDIQANLVRAAGDIRGYSQLGGIGLRVNSDKSHLMTTLDFSIVDCETGFADDHGGEGHEWRVKIHTAAGQAGFVHQGNARRSFLQLTSRGNDSRTLIETPGMK